MLEQHLPMTPNTARPSTQSQSVNTPQSTTLPNTKLLSSHPTHRGHEHQSLDIMSHPSATTASLAET